MLIYLYIIVDSVRSIWSLQYQRCAINFWTRDLTHTSNTSKSRLKKYYVLVYYVWTIENSNIVSLIWIEDETLLSNSPSKVEILSNVYIFHIEYSVLIWKVLLINPILMFFWDYTSTDSSVDVTYERIHRCIEGVIGSSVVGIWFRRKHLPPIRLL